MESKKERVFAGCLLTVNEVGGGFAGGRIPKAAALMAMILLMPLGAWLIGSGFVWIIPPVYQSVAVLRIDAAPGDAQKVRSEVERLMSGAVMRPAARDLMASDGKSACDPMAEYLLWSSLSVKEWGEPNLIKLEARGAAPEEARRTLMAVVNAYERTLEGSTRGALVHIDPLEALPARVADETRVMLGVAGVALLGLLLSIPLLRRLELALPGRNRDGLPASWHRAAVA